MSNIAHDAAAENINHGPFDVKARPEQYNQHWREHEQAPIICSNLQGGR
jgi:hypothetical protein